MWLDRLERKLGKLAIPNLMRYIIFGSAIVYLAGMVDSRIVYLLNMNPAAVLKGQVWRLVTFVFVPSMGNIFTTLLSLFCYYWIGGALERTWGTFKFNFFYWVGIIAIDLVLFICYFLGYDLSMMYHQAGYLSQSMFLALATMYSDMQVLLMFIIPLKAKWMGWISFAFMAYEFIVGALPIKLLILASMAGYLIFFGPQLFRSIKASIRRSKFQKSTQHPFGGFSRGGDFGQADRSAFNASRNQASGGRGPAQNASKSTGGKIITGVAFHRCTICGITELDDPNMTFRYCSSCNGNYVYCENHIHNHQHIT